MLPLVDRSAPRSGEFFAPLPLAALALLVVNDVWWKGAFHNELTGKLSDVAVCFLMPLFVSELLGLAFALAPKLRLTTGAALTAVLFTLLEVVPPFTAKTLALLASIGPYLGLPGPFEMTSDPTDLLCVPLVPVAYAYGARRLGVGLRAGVDFPGRSEREREDTQMDPGKGLSGGTVGRSRSVSCEELHDVFECKMVLGGVLRFRFRQRVRE